jgi:hypothetical protein
MIGKFIVIETNTNTPQETIRGEIMGPYKTQAEAERWIVEDAVDTLTRSDLSLQEGDAEEWGSDMYICEIKRVCRPVPSVRITARIMDVKNNELRAKED